MKASSKHKRNAENEGNTHVAFFTFSNIKRLVHFVKIYCVLIFKINRLSQTHAVIHQLARKLQTLWTLTPHRKTHPLRCILAVSPPPRSAPSSPLALPPPPLLPISRYVVNREFSVASQNQWPILCLIPLFSPGSAHLQQLHQAKRSVYSPHMDTLTVFEPTVSAESISPLPFLRFLPGEPLPWSISVCCGKQGVCAFAALPSKIQTFQGSQQYNMAALL